MREKKVTIACITCYSPGPNKSHPHLVYGFHAFLNAANTKRGSSSTSFFPSRSFSHFSRSVQKLSCCSILTRSLSGGDTAGAPEGAAPPAINMTVIVAVSPSAKPSSDRVLTSDRGFPFRSSLSLDGSAPPPREAEYFVFSVATVVESGVSGSVSGLSAGFGRSGLSARVTVQRDLLADRACCVCVCVGRGRGGEGRTVGGGAVSRAATLRFLGVRSRKGVLLGVSYWMQFLRTGGRVRIRNGGEGASGDLRRSPESAG